MSHGFEDGMRDSQQPAEARACPKCLYDLYACVCKPVEAARADVREVSLAGELFCPSSPTRPELPSVRPRHDSRCASRPVRHAKQCAEAL